MFYRASDNEMKSVQKCFNTVPKSNRKGTSEIGNVNPNRREGRDTVHRCTNWANLVAGIIIILWRMKASGTSVSIFNFGGRPDTDSAVMTSIVSPRVRARVCVRA